jgi:Mrp family chromosome partitioning ATPase/capsular polysaccharide biosynthesis protein
MEETLYEDEGISISELIGIVLKHFKLLLIVFGIIVLACVGYILTNDPTYTATTTVSVESIKNLTAWDTTRTDTRNITTELQFLTRDETIRSALQRLNLASYQRKDGSTYEDLLTDKKKFKGLQEAITTSEIKDTNSVSISLEHSNPVFAQDFLKALTSEFSAAVETEARTQLKNTKADLSAKLESLVHSLSNLKLELEELQNSSNSDYQNTLAIFETTNVADDMTNRTNTYLGLTNPALLELAQRISEETTLVADYRIQLQTLDAYMSSQMYPVVVINQTELLNEDGESNNLLILAVGVLLGAALALLSTLLAEYLSDTIDDEQSLKKILGKEAKILTTIPPGSKDINTEMEILEHPDSAAGSAYTHLAGIMMYAPNTNIFTLGSLSYGEGTSYTTLNIALSMVKSGKRVLVIGTANEGMNYQRLYAKITSHVEIASSAHLHSFSLDKPCKPAGEGPELDIAVLDENPKELGQILNSSQFVEYLGSVSALYDVVLIDGPTFRSASNLLAVSRATNGLILNIRSFVGSRGMLKALLHTFELCNLPLAGVILNNIAGKPSYQERQEIKAHDKALTALMSGNGSGREAKLLTKASSR